MLATRTLMCRFPVAPECFYYSTVVVVCERIVFVHVDGIRVRTMVRTPVRAHNIISITTGQEPLRRNGKKTHERVVSTHVRTRVPFQRRRRRRRRRLVVVVAVVVVVVVSVGLSVAHANTRFGTMVAWTPSVRSAGLRQPHSAKTLEHTDV
jgi:hypothetical protein